MSPGERAVEIPLKFAEIVGLTTASTPCTAGCTGTASQYVNHTVKGGTAFIVELPGNDAGHSADGRPARRGDAWM